MSKNNFPAMSAMAIVANRSSVSTTEFSDKPPKLHEEKRKEWWNKKLRMVCVHKDGENSLKENEYFLRARSMSRGKSDQWAFDFYLGLGNRHLLPNDKNDKGNFIVNIIVFVDTVFIDLDNEEAVRCLFRGTDGWSARDYKVRHKFPNVYFAAIVE